ncbi:hypothetical protein L7F22_044171 [Adiantum nelumboides]|nr:hypothetical protein [Adiantum nelumboides]
MGRSPWVSGSPSPYYTKKSHATLREYVREWSEKHVSNELAIELDRKGITDDQLYKKFTKDGFLIPFALGFTIPKKFYQMCGGQKLPGNVEPEDWDAFHDMIMIDELSRQGSMGPLFCCYAGLSYGAGPIIHFASDQVQNKFLPDLLTGKKRICLAVTEPRAGSDVAGYGTTADRTPDGKHFIVNGEKKWITNGIYSDYFTTSVRTSGSTYVTFEDVKVPVENVIGKEGEAFKYVMYNFMHERLSVIYLANRLCRVCLEDVVEHYKRRKAFGKALMEQAVVRYKIAQMARQTEALTAWIEATVYQMSRISIEEANVKLGGQTALLKAHATITLEFIANESVKLFGGMGLTKCGAVKESK